MLKKSVCGLTIFVTGLLVWSCGDGSVDSLNDNELLMISRFPSTIDYDMLNRVVEDCKRDQACWDKALKTGEIYTGDYTKVLRDSSGNIVVVEGDSAYVWKDGKKLPVFNFSSNSAGDDDDVTSGSSSMSGSSSKRSSSSVSIEDDANVGGSQGSENGSSGGTGPREHADEGGSSSSKVSSSSVDASQYSNKGEDGPVNSSFSTDVERSSGSTIVIGEQSSESQSSSSTTPYQLSSSSVGQHSGGGGSAGSKCDVNSLKGTCSVDMNPGYVKESVTYTFKLADDNTCEAYDEVEWNVTDPDDGADVTHYNDPSTTRKSSYTFAVKYSKLGKKKNVMFSMGGANKQCPVTEIKRRCEKNSYSCTRSAPKPRENIWSPSGISPVSYTWTLNKLDGSCLDVKTRTWGGAVSGTGESVTKSFSTEINAPVYVDVEDELGNVDRVDCDYNAVAVSEPEYAPTCNVANFAWPVNYQLTVTPTVTGCDYSVFNSDKCSYSLATGGSELVGGTKYVSGALKSIDGESAAGSVEYTLTMTNYRGTNSCKFDVNYVVPEAVTFDHNSSKTFESGSIYAITYSKTGSALVCSANHPAFECNGTLYPTNQNSHTAVSNPSSNCTILKVVGSGTLSCQFTW